MRISSKARFELLDRLLDEVLQLPPDRRADFLVDRCGEDRQLLEEITTLLEAEARAGKELGDSVGDHLGDHARTILSGAEARLGGASFVAGDEVGPWRIEALLGEGGMARVYRAVRADGELERPVALKVVKRGLDTDEVLGRFRHERRILASLDHPSIARLYDGGVTEDGRPYFVMEVVEGRPITRYCEEEGLGLEARTRLLTTVCRALEAAHARLVVHRDLKPSNVLVTDDGVPKLVDFGIAKLLEDEPAPDAPRTRTGMRVLTPEYAAPEQIRGDAVTTATDVHGVGLLLYELVAGKRAFPSDGRAPLEAERRVMEEEPPPPSRLHTGPAPRRILRDLDGVVERCLAKDPAGRYRSVGELTADLEAALSGRALVARPLSSTGRALRALRRNPLPTAAATGLALFLGGVTVWSNIQRHRVEAALAVAEEERATAEEVTDFVTDMFAAADPFPQGTRRDTLPVSAFLAQAEEEVRAELGDRPVVQASLLSALGRLRMSVGSYGEAEDLLSEAVERARALPPGEGRDQRLASTLVLLGSVYQRTARAPEAEPLLSEAAELQARLHGAASTQVATALGNMATLLQDQGRFEEAVPLYDSALALVRASTPVDSSTLLNLLNPRAALAYRLGDLPAAETSFETLAEIQRARLGPDHPAVAREVQNLAFLRLRSGRPAEAIPGFEEALRILEPALGMDHPQVAIIRGNLGDAYARVDRLDEAEDALSRSVEAQRAAGTGPAMASTLLIWGELRAERGQMDSALDFMEEAHWTFDGILGPEHPQTAASLGRLGRTRCLSGDAGAGRALLEDARRRLEATGAAGARWVDDVEVWQRACEAP